MANSREHIFWGAIAGAGVCLANAWMAGQKVSLSEFLGSTLSGALLAKLPDFLEPATHPNHRSFFHSTMFAGTVLPTAWSIAQQQREEEIRLAQECEWHATISSNGQEKRIWKEQASVHRFYAGMALGFIPGYASHLAADALTPKSLPFL
jgi:hypothetical protein